MVNLMTMYLAHQFRSVGTSVPYMTAKVNVRRHMVHLVFHIGLVTTGKLRLV